MKRLKHILLIVIITMCSSSPKEDGVTSVMDTDKGRELGEEALSLAEGETEAVSDEDSPIVLAQCLRENNYNVSDPKNFLDLYLSVSAIFEELSQTEQEESEQYGDKEELKQPQLKSLDEQPKGIKEAKENENTESSQEELQVTKE